MEYGQGGGSLAFLLIPSLIFTGVSPFTAM